MKCYYIYYIYIIYNSKLLSCYFLLDKHILAHKKTVICKTVRQYAPVHYKNSDVA